MDQDRQSCVDQILEAIEYGHLSYEEIERRLNKTIDDELSGSLDSEYNATKVELCNSLLWQLKTHGKLELHTPSENIKEKIQSNHTVYKHKKAVLHRSICAVAAVLVFVVGVTLLSGISPIQWFTSKSSEDEQQYIVELNSISIDTISKAIAEHSESGILSLSTSDYSELIHFLGFDPFIAPDIAGSYTIDKYNARVSQDNIFLSCRYRNTLTASDLSLVLREYFYLSSDQAYTRFEQDKEGDQITIHGIMVYKYMNSNRTNYVWIHNNTVYSVTTDASGEDCEKLLNDIITWREIK